MGKNKGKTPERSSARLSAKRNNQAAKSETELQQGCADYPQKKQRKGCQSDPQKKQQACKISERSCARLSAKRNNQAQAAKSEAEQQVCPNVPKKRQEVENLSNENTLLEEMPQKKKRKLRVQLDDTNKQRLDDFAKCLNFRSAGAAIEWFSPNEMKGLSELTKKMGFEKGGQTIDWLLSMTPSSISRLTKELGFRKAGRTVDWLLPKESKRLIEVTKELGFTEIGQTIECLLGMATYGPLLELSNLLGFQDRRKTIEWLLNEAQNNVAAINNKDLPPALRFPLTPAQFASGYPTALNIPHGQSPVNQVGDTLISSNPRMQESFGNHGVPDQMMPPNLNATGNQFHVGETQRHHDQFWMVNSEPRHPLQFQNDTSSWLPENPQQNHFQTNSRDLQGGPRHAENQFSNWMVGQEVAMQQSIQGRSLPNSNYVDPYVNVNSDIQMQYPSWDLNQGQHNMYNDIMRRRMQAESIGYQFSREVGGNPSNNVDLGLPDQVFPSSVTHLAGMPTGLQVPDNISAKDGMDTGTINAGAFVVKEEAGFLSRLPEREHFH